MAIKRLSRTLRLSQPYTHRGAVDIALWQNTAHPEHPIDVSVAMGPADATISFTLTDAIALHAALADAIDAVTAVDQPELDLDNAMSDDELAAFCMRETAEQHGGNYGGTA